MSIVEHAVHALQDADAGLRRLLAEAADSASSDDLVRVAAALKGLRHLLEELEAARSHLLGGPSQNSIKLAAGTRLGEPKPRGGSTSSTSYPKFARSGEILVKIGWSRSRRAEYHHKAPFGVVRDLVYAIERTASKRGRFSMDKILPLKSTDTNAEIPAYQAYACLAWLRHVGLVRQLGRNQYAIEPEADLSGRAETFFRQLHQLELGTEAEHTGGVR